MSVATHERSGTIQVRVGELRQLFNSMDPSPFRERDLDPDCEEFIVSWAREFTPDKPLRIEIRVEREHASPDVLAQIGPAVRHHFVRDASLQELKFRRTAREGRFSLLIGVATLVACMSTATLAPASRCFERGVLYGLWPVLRERRLLERLANADVVLTADHFERVPHHDPAGDDEALAQDLAESSERAEG